MNYTAFETFCQICLQKKQNTPATIFALLRGFVFLIAAFIIMPRALGTPGIWLAMPVSETMTTFVIICCYIFKRRKKTGNLKLSAGRA